MRFNRLNRKIHYWATVFIDVLASSLHQAPAEEGARNQARFLSDWNRSETGSDSARHVSLYERIG